MKKNLFDNTTDGAYNRRRNKEEKRNEIPAGERRRANRDRFRPRRSSPFPDWIPG